VSQKTRRKISKRESQNLLNAQERARKEENRNRGGGWAINREREKKVRACERHSRSKANSNRKKENGVGQDGIEGQREGEREVGAAEVNWCVGEGSGREDGNACSCGRCKACIQAVVDENTT